MERRESAIGLSAKQWKVQIVDVEVQDIKIAGTLAHPIQHGDMVRDRIADGRIEAESPSRTWNELG